MSDAVVLKIRWYALYVRSRFENRVNHTLQLKNMECFLPAIKEEHRWSDRNKIIVQPLFSGYVFVRTDMKNRLDILETDGVVHVVGIHGKPSPIPDEQIEWLKILVKHPEALHREDTLESGERVKVISGPLQGVEGTIVMVKGSSRVVVSIDAIRQHVSVDVSPEFLRRVGC